MIVRLKVEGWVYKFVTRDRFQFYDSPIKRKKWTGQH